MLPEGYDDPTMMKGGLPRMWATGKADMPDVMEILRMSRVDVMYAASEAGYGLHLEGDAEEDRRAEFARLIAEAKDEGTRH